MIVGFGIDVVNIIRLEKAYVRFGERLWTRLFTERERAYVGTRKTHQVASYAKRFAAKEAFVKALGTGFRKGISWQDIEILSDALGAPKIHVRGAAHLILTSLSDEELRVDLSMSDDYPIAQAAVIISRRPDGRLPFEKPPRVPKSTRRRIFSGIRLIRVGLSFEKLSRVSKSTCRLF